jgi:hypothetical protein
MWLLCLMVDDGQNISGTVLCEHITTPHFLLTQVTNQY